MVVCIDTQNPLYSLLHEQVESIKLYFVLI